MAENQLGSYGPWAATHLGTALPGLSFRREEFRRIGVWRNRARARMVELLAAPDLGSAPAVRVDRRHECDGLHVEELSWQLPAGPRTKAVFLKPAASRGRLPAVLALHD
ncbi:MAG: hypothetical protein O2782_13650, partial [bacterium]|nr:hypothetical protein [bacterium]